MIIWCIIILALGIVGILQEFGVLTNLGISYRLSTWIALLIALGLLVRVRFKQKIGEKEMLRAEIEKLKAEIGNLKGRIKELESLHKT